MVERSDTLATNLDSQPPPDANLTCALRRANQTFEMMTGIQKSTKFDWTEEQIGLLQSAYHIGYISSMMFGAHFIITGLGLFIGTSLLLAMSALTCFLFPLVTLMFNYRGAFLAQLFFGKYLFDLVIFHFDRNIVYELNHNLDKNRYIM